MSVYRNKDIEAQRRVVIGRMKCCDSRVNETWVGPEGGVRVGLQEARLTMKGTATIVKQSEHGIWS